MKEPKRSREPIVWLLFGAGTTISAIVFPVLTLIVGFLIPFGLLTPKSLDMFYSLTHTLFGQLLLLCVLILPVWGAFHRIHHGLHDLKIHLPFSGAIFYGLAGLFSILACFAVF